MTCCSCPCCHCRHKRCVTPHSEPVYSLRLGQSVSNAVGNECSESMREMCGRVSFSVGANAQVYAPRSSWNVQELKETARQMYPLSHPLFSPFFHSSSYYPFFISLAPSLLLLLLWLCSLFQPPAGRSFGRKQRTDVSLHVVVH